jgi:hypothetical protein
VIKRRLRASVRALSASTALIIITTVSACIFGTGALTSAWARPKGLLQIGFTGTIAASTGTPQRFKNFYLNVQEVRVNANANAGASSGGWQTVVVTPGIAQQSAGKPADLQVDLNDLQNLPVLFNAGAIKRDTYKLVEVILDTKHPGEIVPLCPPSGAGGLEGCAPFPITLQNAGNLLSPLNTSVSVGHFTMSSLLINLNATVISAPSAPGQDYTVNVVVSQAPVQQSMSLISGNIAGTSGVTPNIRRVRNLAVTAEVAGTNIQVSSSPVVNGNFQIQLPAANTTGTLYDLYTAGGGTSYSAERLAPAFPGTNTIPNFIVDTGQALGTISGNITDNCTGDAIAGATVQILIPPQGSTVNCASAANAGQCITVATASTDNTGHFPLTGQVKVPAPFNNIPLPPSGTTYALEITAPGYDPIFTTGAPTVPPVKKTVLNGGTCATSKGTCDFALTSGQIAGTVNLTAAPGNETVVVQVFAEEAGTNNVVAALVRPLIFRNQTQSLPFTIVVPSGPASFDFYATAIDLYTNITDPYTGHTILVQPGVPGFSGTPSCTAVTPSAVPFEQSMDCTGHGSLAGTFVNPGPQTTAVLMKDGVQIMTSAVGPVLPLGVNPANPTFAFCAPGDTYSVQRFNVTNPPAGTVPVETPTPAPVGTPTTTSIPTPLATSTPCPTTCSTSGGCPGVCNGIVANPL